MTLGNPLPSRDHLVPVPGVATIIGLINLFQPRVQVIRIARVSAAFDVASRSYSRPRQSAVGGFIETIVLGVTRTMPADCGDHVLSRVG